MDNNFKPLNNNKIQNMYNVNNNENNAIRNKSFNVNSESIVSFILEKLISLTITESIKNEIETKNEYPNFLHLTLFIPIQ